MTVLKISTLLLQSPAGWDHWCVYHPTSLFSDAPKYLLMAFCFKSSEISWGSRRRIPSRYHCLKIDIINQVKDGHLI